MRQIISSGSVKGIYLNREEILKRLYGTSSDALKTFPEIKEIRLFGSLAKHEETGLSDIDIFVLVKSKEKNPIERMKPYFDFFVDNFEIAIDMIVATKKEAVNLKEILRKSLLLAKRTSV